MSDQGRLLDIKEAAEFLNVSETSLRRWTNSGRLACLRIGRRRERRFRQEDLLAFMELDQPVGRSSTAVSRVGGLTPIDGSPVTHGTHLCGLYATDDDRVRLAVSFLSGGLAPTSVCYVVAPDRTRSTLLNALEQREPSLATHRESGRLVTADYIGSAGAQIEFFRAQFEAAVRSGVQSIRLVADLVGLAAHVGSRGVAEFEAAYVATIAKRFPVVTLCLYDARHFGGAEIVAALRAHPDTFQHPHRVL